MSRRPADAAKRQRNVGVRIIGQPGPRAPSRYNCKQNATRLAMGSEWSSNQGPLFPNDPTN
jgi:hypothetical protein